MLPRYFAVIAVGISIIYPNFTPRYAKLGLDELEPMEINTNQIENRIYAIRGIQVMLDSDLAGMYQTETKYINRAVNRNPSRFPEAFAFEHTQDEWTNLKFQIGTSSLVKLNTVRPRKQK